METSVGVLMLHAFSGSVMAIDRTGCGFPWVKIPERYMPQRTPIFLHINDPAMEHLENQSNIHITLGDLDYF